MTTQEKIEVLWKKIAEARGGPGAVPIFRRPGPDLADVLLVLGETMHCDGVGVFWELDKMTGELRGCRNLGGIWNLRADSLNDQSDETIDFLHQLLS